MDWMQNRKNDNMHVIDMVQTWKRMNDVYMNVKTIQ